MQSKQPYLGTSPSQFYCLLIGEKAVTFFDVIVGFFFFLIPFVFSLALIICFVGLLFSIAGKSVFPPSFHPLFSAKLYYTFAYSEICQLD